MGGGIGVGVGGVGVEPGAIIGVVDVGGSRKYSPTPPPTTAAPISRMVTMWLEFWLEFSGWLAGFGFFGVGATGVSPNSQMV